MSDDHDNSALDEQLSALLDGELDTAAAAELERRIAVDPAVARRYETLKNADRAFDDALARLDDVPLPDSVLNMLDNRSNEAASSPRDGVTPHRGGRLVFGPLPVALAAGLALVVGFLAAQLLPADGGPSGAALLAGTVAPQSPLHDVLETRPSGTVVRMSSAVRAAPVQTFRTTDGTVCREIQISGGAGTRSAVACRNSGSWQVRLAEFQPSDGGYVTASTDSSAVAAAVERWKHGKVLEPEAEEGLLESWR